MRSTDLHPLSYFEYIINRDNLLTEIKREFQYSDCVSVNFDDELEVRYVKENEFGELEHKKLLTSDVLLPRLYREYEKAKNHLYNFCIHNTSLATETYLRIQGNILQNIIINNSELINSNNYLLLPIRNIANYINKVLLAPGMIPFVLDESNISFDEKKEKEQIVFTSDRRTDLEIIHSVIDYMSGTNQKREAILNHEDFELLVKYTTELIENENVPSITKPLHPNLSTDLLRFTFWVLHKEFYTSTRIKPYFYEFIKRAFVNFKDSEVSSIQSLFGTRTRITRDKFIPEIISRHLKQGY